MLPIFSPTWGGFLHLWSDNQWWWWWWRCVGCKFLLFTGISTSGRAVRRVSGTCSIWLQPNSSTLHFLGGFFHILGKAARFSMYMIILLFPIRRYVIQLFLPHRTCVQVWCTIFSKIFEVHDDYRGPTVGRHVEPCCLWSMILDWPRVITNTPLDEHQSRWLHEDCLFCINVNVNTSQVL